jgi:hypothetical protein
MFAELLFIILIYFILNYLMMNEMDVVTDRIEQKYLTNEPSTGRHDFRKNVVDTELNKAIECLKSYMGVTGLLSAE